MPAAPHRSETPFPRRPSRRWPVQSGSRSASRRRARPGRPDAAVVCKLSPRGTRADRIGRPVSLPQARQQQFEQQLDEQVNEPIHGGIPRGVGTGPPRSVGDVRLLTGAGTLWRVTGTNRRSAAAKPPRRPSPGRCSPAQPGAGQVAGWWKPAVRCGAFLPRRDRQAPAARPASAVPSRVRLAGSGVAMNRNRGCVVKSREPAIAKLPLLS